MPGRGFGFGGGGDSSGNLVKLGTTTLAANGATINITGLPAADRLLVILEGKGTAALNIRGTFNNDGGANYTCERLIGNGAVVSAVTATDTYFNVGQFGTTASIMQMLISNPATDSKAFSWQMGYSAWSESNAGLWASNVQVNRIDFTAPANDFVAGAKLTVYSVV